MDNKQDRQLYWEVKQFLTKTPAVPVQKPTTLKDSVNSVLQENKPFRQNNFSQESLAMQPTQKTIGAHSNLINANKPSCAAYTKNGNTNPFNLNEGFETNLSQSARDQYKQSSDWVADRDNQRRLAGIEADRSRLQNNLNNLKDMFERDRVMDVRGNIGKKSMAAIDATRANREKEELKNQRASQSEQSAIDSAKSRIESLGSNANGGSVAAPTTITSSTIQQNSPVTQQQASNVSGNATPTATSVRVANLPKPINDVYAFSPQSSMNGRNVGNILDRLRVGPGIGQSETKLNADIPPVANPVRMPQRKSEIVDSEQSTQPARSSDIQGMMASSSSDAEQSSQTQAPLGSVDTSIRPIETGGSLNLSGKLGTSQQQEFRYSSGRRV